MKTSDLPKYLPFILIFWLLLLCVSGTDCETSEIREYDIQPLNDTLKLCQIFGKKSAREGNVNCSQLPGLGDEQMNQQCAAKFAEGCMEVKFDRFCYQGTISFLRDGKCSPLKDEDDFSNEAHELCCGMCAKQREYCLKWKICRKNIDIPCCCFLGIDKRNDLIEKKILYDFIDYQAMWEKFLPVKNPSATNTKLSDTVHRSIIQTEQPTTKAPQKACKSNEERNEEGVCMCQGGYIKNSTSGHCEDINECETGEHSCASHSSTCQNLVGSYECLCKPGFEKLYNETECVNINECERPDLEKCHLCLDTIGSFKCQCHDGYILQADDKTCIEENKCESPSFCNGICNKFDSGDYTCKKCPKGPFRLDRENEKCIPVKECKEGEDCSEGQCDDQCDEGFSKNPTTGFCENVNHCEKDQGYATCEDRSAMCRNLIDSYYCLCPQGRLWDENRTKCEGFDQCKYQRHKCHHKCMGFWTSFSCYCHPGYDLLPDKRTCVSENPCNEKAFCDGVWENTDEQCRCKKCPNGKLISDSEGKITEECLPIDQCKERNICSAGETCVNLKDCDSTVGCGNLSCPEDYDVRNEDGICNKKEDVVDDQALAMSKRVIHFAWDIPSKSVAPAKFWKNVILYRFNRTDCAIGDTVKIHLENIEPKFTKKYQVNKNDFKVVHQRTSHDLLLSEAFIYREQEFIVNALISCNRKKLHAYNLHVYIV